MKFIKKHIKFLVLILTCILVYAIYNDNPPKVNYISLGDGFAEGINSYNAKDYGYNMYLRDYLKKNQKLHTYYQNFSYQECTIRDIYKDILINKKDQNGVNLKQALRDSNLLTISVGLNDLFYENRINTQLTESEQKQILKKINQDLNQMYQTIRKYYKFDIYVIGYYNFFPHNSVEKRMLEALNKELEELSTKKRVKYINVDNLNNNYLENPNSFYPNSQGYQKIYQQILKDLDI